MLSTCEKRVRQREFESFSASSTPDDCAAGSPSKKYKGASEIEGQNDETNKAILQTHKDNSSSGTGLILRSSLKTALGDNVASIRRKEHITFGRGTKERDGPAPLFAAWDRFVWDICSGVLGNPHILALEMRQLEYKDIEDDFTMNAEDVSHVLDAILAAIQARDRVISSHIKLSQGSVGGVDGLCSPVSSSRTLSPPSSPRAGSHSPRPPSDFPSSDNEHDFGFSENCFLRAIVLGKRLGEEALGLVKPSVQQSPTFSPSLNALCEAIFLNYANSDRLVLRGMHCLSIDLLNRLETVISSAEQMLKVSKEGPPRVGRSVGLLFRHSPAVSSSTLQSIASIATARVDEIEEKETEEEAEDGSTSTLSMKATEGATVTISIDSEPETKVEDGMHDSSPLPSSFDAFLDCLISSPAAEAAAASYRAKKSAISIPILPAGGGTCSKVGLQHQAVLQMLILLTRAASLAYPV